MIWLKIERMNLKKKASDKKILLLAIIGTLTALEKGKISMDEASAFLFHPGMVDMLGSCHCSKDILELVKEGCELEDVESLIPDALYGEINRLCHNSLEILGSISGQESTKWFSEMQTVQKKLRKKEYLEGVYQTGILPGEKGWDRIRRYTKDKDPKVRLAAGQSLGMFCCEAHERLLRHMTYDKKGRVRVCAVTELKMGIQEESLNRLFDLLGDRKKTIRGNAAKSFFDVWVNRNGYTKSSMEGYRKKVEAVYSAEEEPWVLAFYERNRYLSGDREGIIRLKNLLYREGEYDIQSIAAELLMEIRSVSNESEVNQILEEADAYVPGEWYLKKRIEYARKRKELPKVLIVDRDNSSISQMMEYLGENGEWQIESAGITPAAEIKRCVREGLRCRKWSDITSFQYPKGIRNIWKYDYIVPVGIKLNQEEFILRKTVPIFENKEEDMLDVEQAEQMLMDLKDFIDNDLKKGQGESVPTGELYVRKKSFF